MIGVHVPVLRLREEIGKVGDSPAYEVSSAAADPKNGVLEYPAYNKSTGSTYWTSAAVVAPIFADDVAEPSATDLGWSIPGEGNPRLDCGKFRWRGCLRRMAHPGHKVYVEKYHASCNGRDCPVCVDSWGSLLARRIEARLGAFRPASIRGPSHVVFSPPAELAGEDVKCLRRRLYGIAKSAGMLGGVVFFHPMRRKSRVDREYSPHFHVLGYGFMERSSSVWARSGWVYKNLGVRRSVGGTLSYLASHAGYKAGFAVASWFGELSYNKFRGGKVPGAKVDPCPECGGSLSDVCWRPGEPPMLGEFAGMTWPWGWDLLRRRFNNPTKYRDGLVELKV